MLCSLLENNSAHSFQIYIIYSNLKPTIRKRLKHFILEKYNLSLNFIVFDQDKVRTFPRKEADHVSLATYYRLFLPALLPVALNKVLFLDADMIIRADIMDLWTTPIEEYSLAAIENPNSNYLKVPLSIPLSAKYFNAGVLLINLQYWRQHAITQQLTAYIKKHDSNLICHDQDALNAILWNKYKVLPPEWNLIEKNQVISPKIIHYVGARKPWHLRNKHPYRAAYFKYLRKTPWKNYSPLMEYLQRVSGYYLSQLFKMFTTQK